MEKETKNPFSQKCLDNHLMLLVGIGYIILICYTLIYKNIRIYNIYELITVKTTQQSINFQLK